MAISLDTLQRGVAATAPIICCFGDEGIGKSKFASNAPNPVFIFTENSLGKMDVVRWQASSFEDVMEMTSVLINEKHDFKTVVYDTLDWFEPMVWKYLVQQQPTTEKGKPITSIEDYGYGKGYKFALDYWTEFLNLVEELRQTKNMAVIFLAHSTLQKISPPDSESYDSWTLKLQNSDKTSAKDKITEYCDAVLFAKWQGGIKEEDMGFNQSRNRGIGSGERIVYTEKRPAWDAKNRYDLPSEIYIRSKDWSELWNEMAKNIPWFSQFAEPEARPEPKAKPAPEQDKIEPEQKSQEIKKEAKPKFLQAKGE